MTGEDQFGKKRGGSLGCEEWEALLADALDGTLPANLAPGFHAHGASCASCGELLGHAEQGRAWLEYLHDEPVVPALLLGRILEKTTNAGSLPLPLQAGTGAIAMPWRRSLHETRLLMTVAMAFFSIALTLNLAGVKLSHLRIADLRPSTMGSMLSRQYYGARGSLVRYYDNLRLVYQLQAQIRELRQQVEATPKHSGGGATEVRPPAQQPVKPSSHEGGQPAPLLLWNVAVHAAGANRGHNTAGTNCISVGHTRTGLEQNAGRSLV